MSVKTEGLKSAVNSLTWNATSSSCRIHTLLGLFLWLWLLVAAARRFSLVAAEGLLFAAVLGVSSLQGFLLWSSRL